MIHVASLAIRRPLVAIVLWLALVAALGYVGRDLSSKTSPTIVAATGTQSARAAELVDTGFGDAQLVPILLRGPAAALDRQGPPLVAALRARPDSRVLSPWDIGPGSEQLRPKRRAATILVSVERSEKDVADHVDRQIRGMVRARISPPVTAVVTGAAALSNGLSAEAVSGVRTASLVALPLLFLLLLVAFRAPVAALLPVLLGASVLPATNGLLSLAAGIVSIDAVAGVFGTVIGLALGTAFSTLVVARFRSELAESGEAAGAARAAAGSAGRAVLLAGTAVAGAMALACVFAPTRILVSIGLGAALGAVLAAIAAVGPGSAAVALLGRRVEALAFGGGLGSGDRDGAPRASGAAAARPLAAGAVTLVLLLVLAIPAIGVKTGPPDARVLPADNQARRDFETFTRVMGPGWGSPFEVIVVKRNGAITTRRFLARLAAFQRRIAADPEVVSVVGPGVIAAQAKELAAVPRGLKQAASSVKTGKRDLTRLAGGVEQAATGVDTLRAGLSDAAEGAAQLQQGGGQAEAGATKLRAGLDQAVVGATKIVMGLGTAADGAERLATGSSAAADGARQLADGLAEAETAVANGLPVLQALDAAARTAADRYPDILATSQSEAAGITEAQRALEAMPEAHADPGYPALKAALDAAAADAATLAGQLDEAQATAQAGAAGIAAIVTQVSELSGGVEQLSAGAKKLEAGTARLAEGNAELAKGLRRLRRGGGELNDGLDQLAAGAAELETGLGTLAEGTGTLASGLAGGVAKSAPLATGLDTITAAVRTARSKLPAGAVRDYARLRASSPRLFDSGYFTLAALDGAPRADRDAARFAVNVDRGGLAGRITVIPEHGPAAAGTRALHRRLDRMTADFAASTGTQAAVGGPAAQVEDLRSLTARRLPLVVLCLVTAGFLMLVLVTRGVVVPLVAVGLDLAVLAATFGVIGLLFGTDHPLGGPGFIDPISATGVVTIVLGLGLAWQVILLAGIAERRSEPEPAGGARAQRVLAAAILVTLVVFAIFARTELVTVRQFAIAVGVGSALSGLSSLLILGPVARHRRDREVSSRMGRAAERLPRVHFERPAPRS